MKNNLIIALSTIPLFFVFGANASDTKKNLTNITCEDMLVQDNDLVFTTVGYNWSFDYVTGNYDLVPVESVEDIAVDDVITYCKQNPKSTVNNATKAVKANKQ